LSIPSPVRKPVGRGLLLGGLGWIIAVVAAFKFDDRAIATKLLPLLDPVSGLGGLGAPLPGGGYEATPVQLFLGMAGIALSALPYLVLGVIIMWSWYLIRSPRR
jgi:hypothetical protein